MKLVEYMYGASNDFDVSQMYGSEKLSPTTEQEPTKIIDRMQGVNMTTARTNRHITINIGQDRVTLPSPQFVYEVELRAKRAEREVNTLKQLVERLRQENQKIRAEMDRFRRELDEKVSY